MSLSATDMPDDPLNARTGIGLKDYRIVPALLLLVFAAMALRVVWLSDDAFITMRTVDNFVNGYGLTWNPGERVQAFTHPLWLFVVSAFYLLVGHPYYALVLVSLLFSVLAVAVVVFGIARSGFTGAFAAFAFVLSAAFLDYTSSGLENPLTYFLVAIYLYLLLRRHADSSAPVFLTIIAGLAWLNRADIILVILPSLVFVLWKIRWKKALVTLLIGTLPFSLWHLFSLVYFGYLFPNTYYAKLNTGIPGTLLVEQGFHYFVDSITVDPVTLIVIVATLILVATSRNGRHLSVALGIALYLVYILRIGGDFMSGRFFAVPFFVSVILLISGPLTDLINRRLTPIVILIFLGMIGSRTPILTDHTYGTTGNQGEIRPNGICDERGFYFQRSGLPNISLNRTDPPYQWTEALAKIGEDRDSVVLKGAVGFYGYSVGRSKYVIDQMALADPLLSHLPISYTKGWRIGHYARELPTGYRMSRRIGENKIFHSSLARVFDDVLLITKGPLFSADRWSAIFRMNLHLNDSLIYLYTRSPSYTEYSKVNVPFARGTPWNATGTLLIRDIGLSVGLGEVRRDTLLEISVDHNDEYVFLFNQGSDVRCSVLVVANAIPEHGLRIDTIAIPEPCAQVGYNTIVVHPKGGDGKYSLGHLRFFDTRSRSSQRRN